MKKFSDSDFETDHHKPRTIDKRKHHKKGYHEDAPDMRKHRVNFKKYLNSLKESEASEFDFDDND
jgi:hypothetical protein